MRRVQGRAMAVGSVVMLGCLTIAAAVVSVANAPKVVSTAPRRIVPRDVDVCGPFPPRHAAAVDVADDGKVRWSTPLAVSGQTPDANVAPLETRDAVDVAEDGTVHALALSDGRPTWSWAGGRGVYGMWAWHDTIVVLTDQVGDDARLTSLDDRTGTVRWQLPIPDNGLIGNPTPTDDGGLAWLRADGEVQVVDLASGRIRWSVHRDRQAVPVTSDGNVLVGSDGVLAAFDDETGRRRWTVTDLPPQPEERIVAGLVLVTSGIVGPSDPTALTAVDPGTGQVAWRFDPGTAVTVLSAGPAGLAVAAYVPDRLLSLIDTRDGAVRWTVDTAVTLNTFPLVSSADIVSVEGGVQGYPGSNLVERAAGNGRRRWAVGVPGTPTGLQPVLSSGGLVLIEASGAAGNSSLFAYDATNGHRAWRAEIPEFVQVPPVAVPGGFLVQASTPVSACAMSSSLPPTPVAGAPPHDV